MSREYRLQDLLKNRHIWRPGDLPATDRKSVPSGFPELDYWLGGGWPIGVLTELWVTRQGIGEVTVLMPGLAHLCTNSDEHGSKANRIVWIAPPHIPYAPAFAQYGVDVARLLIIRPVSSKDILWAMEQALCSQACNAVFAWAADIDDRAVRRLQLAAEAHACWAIVFRKAHRATGLSSMPLRIELGCRSAPAEGRLELNILRNRYGPTGSLSVQC